MRYKYSELTPEKLSEIEKKSVFVTREYGVGKDPLKDKPDFIETDRPPSLQIPRWAVIRAEELARSGMEMDEVYKVLLQEHKVRNGKADYVGGSNKVMDSTLKEDKAPELTEEQIMYINYLATICRMAGVNPRGMNPQEMLDICMASNVNAVSFEEYRERQLELQKTQEENK